MQPLSTFSISSSSLKVTADCSYCDTSTIAHSLAAATAADVAVLAPNWAREMTTDFAAKAAAHHEFVAIATNLRVQPTQQGTLTLASSPGLAD
ncbi:MAG: hypothetical protein AAF609_18850 [Cyanobacteria bacterium P01_C01_bin.120]